MKKILFCIASLTLCLLTQTVYGQKFSLMANVSSFDIDRLATETTIIDYEGSLSASLNARGFIREKWALRLGVGLDNLNYTVSDSISTNYEARRRDLKGILGLERHLIIGNRLDIYPGIYVPITMVGEAVSMGNFENIENGDLRVGFGALIGANLRLFKRILVGVEFDMSYDQFNENFRSNSGELSSITFSGLNYTTAFTLGIGLGY